MFQTNAQNHSKRLYKAVSRLLQAGLALAITAAPSFADPGLHSEVAATSPDQTTHQSAADLGASLEMNCRVANEMGLELFFTVAQGERVPADCLSMLWFSDAPYSGAGLTPPDYEGAAHDVNEFIDQHRNPASTQVPLVRVELWR